VYRNKIKNMLYGSIFTGEGLESIDIGTLDLGILSKCKTAKYGPPTPKIAPWECEFDVLSKSPTSVVIPNAKLP
jgi:hypothetical protein